MSTFTLNRVHSKGETTQAITSLFSYIAHKVKGLSALFDIRKGLGAHPFQEEKTTMKNITKVLTIALLTMALTGVAMAQSTDMSFSSQQNCAVAALTTQTFYATVFNYTSSATDVNGPYTGSTGVTYDLPASEWLGIFLYEMNAGAYTLAQYNYRYDNSTSVRDAVAVDSLALSASSSLAYSGSSSQVLVDFGGGTLGGYVYHYNYDTNTGTSLPDITGAAGTYAVTIELASMGKWIGCWIYNYDTAAWEPEGYYSLWDSLLP